MSAELSRRTDELSRERVWLREPIRRTGLRSRRVSIARLAAGRVEDRRRRGAGERGTAHRSHEWPRASHGDLPREFAGRTRDVVKEAERRALKSRGIAEPHSAAVSVAAVTLAHEPHVRALGVITIARRGHPFTDGDLEVPRSLGPETALALENVELNFQVRRQAVTDELTGLANGGRFQKPQRRDEQVRRYHRPLIMLDIDDFKAVKDTYGHPQGGAVLRHVVRVLQENSRDVHAPARYGGEELSLPHTDLEGAHAFAERIRTAVEGLRIVRSDGQGVLRVTASLGVVASTDEGKDALIADADGALYEGNGSGKNRTISAGARAADVSGAG